MKLSKKTRFFTSFRMTFFDKPNRYKDLILIIILFIFNIAYSQNQQGTGFPNYWSLIIQNRIDDAEVELVQAVPDNPFIYYEASSIIHNFNGDYEKMLSDMLAIISASPDEPLSEVYIRRINELKVLFPNYDEAVKVYQDLLNKGVSNALNRALLIDCLSEDYLNRDRLEKAKTLIEKSGFVLNWMYVAGPFAKDGDTDMDYFFPIETEESTQSYIVGNAYMRSSKKGIHTPNPSQEGTTDKIVKISSKQNHLSKYLNLSSYIFPSVGIAYAYTSIQCEAEQEVILRVLTQAPIKVWINGELVVYKNANLDNYKNEYLAETKLKQGTNDIVVKILQSAGDWRLALQLVRKDGQDFSVKYSEVDKPNFKVVGALCHPELVSGSLKNIEKKMLKQVQHDTGDEQYAPTNCSEESDSRGEVSSPIIKGGMTPPLPGCLGILNDKTDPRLKMSGTSLISLLQKSYYFSSINDFDSVREALNSAKKLYPDCAYVYSQLGRLDIVESSYRTRSGVRLENDAKENYERVLKLMPNSLVANQGLGLFHHFQSRYDEAIKYFKKELDAKKDFFQGNYFLSLAYKGKGWETERVDALKKVLKQFPSQQSAILDLIDYYISKGLYSEAEQTALEGIKLGVPFKNISSKLIMIYQDSGNDKLLLGLLEKIIYRNPDDVNSMRTIAETYKKRGNFKKAIDTYERILKVSQQNFIAERDLGEVLILFGNKEKGLEHLENALKKNPGDYTTRTLYESYNNPLTPFNKGDNAPLTPLKKGIDNTPLSPIETQCIASLQRGMGIEPFYKKYDVSLSDVKIEDYTSEKYPRASEVFLIDVGVFRIQSDGSYEEMAHQAVKILNKKGRENWAEVVVPAGADILIARTIAPDGQIYEPENVQYLVSGTTLSMPKLEDNSVVELSYVRSVSNTYSFWKKIVNVTFYFQQLENPEVLARLVIINSNQHPLKTRLTPYDFEPETADEGDYKIYKWEKHDMDGLKDEPQMPELDKVTSNVKFYTDINFSHILNNTLDAFYDKLKADEDISSKAKELTQNLNNKRDKIESIYNYIRDEIKDTSNRGDTIDIFKLQNGNSTEKIYLMKVMLDTIGINSYIAYAFSEEEKDYLIIPKYDVFFSSFLYIPSFYEENYWVRFVSKYEPFTNVKDSVEEKIAIVFVDDKPQVMRLGGKGQDEGEVKTFVKNEIYDNGVIKLTGDVIMEGGYNRIYREIFSDPTKKEQIAQMIVLRFYNKLNDVKLELLNEKELNRKLGVKFSGTLTDYLQEEQEGLALKPFPDDMNFSSFITSEAREFDYENISLLISRFNEVEYKLPNNLVVKHIPDDYVVASPYGNYSITYQLEDNRIIARRSVMINKIVVKKERWNEFVKFCRDVDEHDRQKIMLKKLSN